MTFDKAGLLKMFAPRVQPIVLEFEDKKMSLYARELSAKQVFELQAKQKAAGKDGDNQSFTFSLLSQTLCDEEGKPVLSYEDVVQLSEMHVKAFGKLAEAVTNAVGLGSPKKDEKGEVPNA